MGFSVTWLDLREPADSRARDPGLMRDAARAAGPDPVVADLGCGTGATMRAMQRELPTARWQMIDADHELTGVLQVAAPDRVRVHHHDLADLASTPLEGATLVTASALLDLASVDWIEGLAQLLAPRKLPLYAALNYDGQMAWQPELPGDAQVTQAFNLHQRGEKGLGRAAGPDAAAEAARQFAALGYSVRTASSPWVLGPDDGQLQLALLKGIAAAATEAGCPCDEWLEARVAAIRDGGCRIGHVDLLALPAAG